VMNQTSSFLRSIMAVVFEKCVKLWDGCVFASSLIPTLAPYEGCGGKPTRVRPPPARAKKRQRASD
jgi:hypothetical protein